MVIGASFALYSAIIGLGLELSSLSVVEDLEPGLVCLGTRYVDSCLPRRFGEPDLGLLCRGPKVIMCGGGDGRRYVGIGVNLDQVIAARISLKILFTLILVGHVLPIF